MRLYPHIAAIKRQNWWEHKRQGIYTLRESVNEDIRDKVDVEKGAGHGEIETELCLVLNGWDNIN